MVPTACHRLLGRRMPASDKQPSASSPSRDSWLSTHGERGALKSLSAPGVALPRPSSLAWRSREEPGSQVRSLEALGCRTCLSPTAGGRDRLGGAHPGGGGHPWQFSQAGAESVVKSRVLSPVQPAWEGKALLHSFAQMYY